MPVDGAALRRGPGELAEEDAEGPAAEAYARLREVLGASFVPTVFRMLGPYERFLTAGVDAVLAKLGAEDLEGFAVKARSAAAAAAAELPGPALRAGDDVAAVAALLDRYNAVNPRGIIIVPALRSALAPAPALVMRAPLPPPFPDLLDDVRACHGDFTVPGLWRELEAGYPSIARDAWALIRPLAGSAKFDAARADLIRRGEEAGAGITVPHPAELGYDAAAQAEIATILNWFAVTIPTLVVEIEVLRARLAAA